MPYQFEETKDSEVLWRYIEVPDLIWSLSKSRFFFRFTSQFKDPFEGQFSKPVIERMSSWEGDTGEANRRTFQQFKEPGFAVQCWHRHDNESDLMWKGYGGHAPIALQTTAEKLRAGLQHIEKHGKVMIGNVRYIDYESVDIHEGNALNPVMHKRHEFSHEREARVALFPIANSDNLKFEGDLGLSVNASLNDVVERIVIAPGQEWMLESYRSLLDKHDCTVPVEASSLAVNPYTIYEERNVKIYVRKEDADQIHIPSHIFATKPEANEHDKPGL